MERTFSSTKIRYKKLSTSGALSARSSRQAGLLARSQAISSNSMPAAMRLIVGAGYDIPLAYPRLRTLAPARAAFAMRHGPRPGRWCTERCQDRRNALPNHSPRISRDLDFFFQHGCLDVDNLASRLFAVGRSPSPSVRPECRWQLL